MYDYQTETRESILNIITCFCVWRVRSSQKTGQAAPDRNPHVKSVRIIIDLFG